MDIAELEKIMQEYGVVLRAIPNKAREVYEASHQDQFPDGRLEYLENYGRMMLIREYAPQHAGQILIESVKSTSATVWFQPRFYPHIEDAVKDLVDGRAKSPNCAEQKKVEAITVNTTFKGSFF